MTKTLATAALLALIAGPALAGFEIQEANTEENAVTLESVNTVFFGDLEDQIRSSHELTVGWGVVHGYAFEFGFELENPSADDESADFSGLELTNTIALIGEEGFSTSDTFALALIAGLEFEFEESSDVSLTLGPAIEAELGGVELLSNTFLEIPLGGGEGLGFSYALGGYYEMTDDVAIGLEAHGEIEEVFDDTPALSEQEHFIGPAVAFEIGLEEDQEVGMRVGTFFGLTDETPTVGLSLNLELEF
ncbi:MAG: hypothetical protein AAFV19_08805 [Pseudomonadota bacterium]